MHLSTSTLTLTYKNVISNYIAINVVILQLYCNKCYLSVYSGIVISLPYTHGELINMLTLCSSLPSFTISATSHSQYTFYICPSPSENPCRQRSSISPNLTLDVITKTGNSPVTGTGSWSLTIWLSRSKNKSPFPHACKVSAPSL